MLLLGSYLIMPPIRKKLCKRQERRLIAYQTKCLLGDCSPVKDLNSNNNTTTNTSANKVPLLYRVTTESAVHTLARRRKRSTMPKLNSMYCRLVAVRRPSGHALPARRAGTRISGQTRHFGNASSNRLRDGYLVFTGLGNTGC